MIPTDINQLIQSIKNMEGSKPNCCCPPGAWPALQTEYKPKGEALTIDNTYVYHVGSSKRAIVIISDIFGATSGRHLAVADTFQSFGYEVFVPEVIPNPYVGNLGPEVMEYIKKMDFNETRQRFSSVFKYLASKGHTKFFVVGFCWGVWATFKLSTEFNCMISIAGMHPSLKLQNLSGGTQLKLTQQIQAPAFLYPAQNDPANLKTGGEVVLQLQKKFGADKVGSIDFPDMMHGWVVRGDLKDQKVYRDTEKAITLASEYFAKFDLASL